MATIEAYDTAEGRRYRVRYRTPERRQTDKRGFRTKRDAELFAASVEVSKARGEFIDATAGRVTVGALGPAWLERQTHVKPSSYRVMETAWRVHVEPRWGAVRLVDVKPTAVEAWVAELSRDRAAATVLRAHGVLASIIDGAMKDRRVLANAARGVNLPRKVRKKRVYLSHERVQLLAGNAGQFRTLTLLLAYTGLRWGEATGLRVQDLDMLRRRVNVALNAVNVGGRIIEGTPKGHSARSVPFPRFLTEDLARQCEGKGPASLVFGSGDHLRAPDGRDGWFVGAIRKSRAVDAGFPRVTIHDLRHTAASLAISSGATPLSVQRMLGHKSAAMTLDTYADLFEDDLDAVAVSLDKAASSAVVGKMWAKDQAKRPSSA